MKVIAIFTTVRNHVNHNWDVEYHRYSATINFPYDHMGTV